MKKMSVGEAAEYFGVSREAIHNRVRRGSLEVVIEDGVKFIMIDTTNKKPTKARVVKTKVSNDDRYYKLLEVQNAKLQEKVEKLEGETRTLRDQKELMLIKEKEKIEQIYKEKDEQLKNILNSISSQFMLNAPQNEEVEALEAEIEESVQNSNPVSLSKYLKSNNYSKKKIEKIKKKFKKIAKKDERVTIIGKKYYIDLQKYEYSDLI
jgi:hypothetical protein